MQDDNNTPEIVIDDIDGAPSDIARNSSDVTVKPTQYSDAFAKVSEENLALKVENHELRLKLKTNEILNSLITPYADRAFVFMCCYCGFVALFLLFNANGKFLRPVESSVMEFLVGSTAVTVIGLVGMVLTGIFVGARK